MKDCPHCGARMKAAALACPECGSDVRTGWKDPDQLESDALDLPEVDLPDDEYQDFLARDLGERPARRAPLWMLLVVLAVVIALVAALL